jgi:hypothetical protein
MIFYDKSAASFSMLGSSLLAGYVLQLLLNKNIKIANNSSTTEDRELMITGFLRILGACACIFVQI